MMGTGDIKILLPWNELAPLRPLGGFGVVAIGVAGTVGTQSRCAGFTNRIHQLNSPM